MFLAFSIGCSWCTVLCSLAQLFQCTSYAVFFFQMHSEIGWRLAFLSVVLVFLVEHNPPLGKVKDVSRRHESNEISLVRFAWIPQQTWHPFPPSLSAMKLSGVAFISPLSVTEFDFPRVDESNTQVFLSLDRCRLDRCRRRKCSRTSFPPGHLDSVDLFKTWGTLGESLRNWKNDLSFITFCRPQFTHSSHLLKFKRFFSK